MLWLGDKLDLYRRNTVAPRVDRTSPLRGRRLLSEGATRPLWGKQGKTWNPTKAVVCSGIWHGIVAMFELINKNQLSHWVWEIFSKLFICVSISHRRAYDHEAVRRFGCHFQTHIFLYCDNMSGRRKEYYR